MGLFTTRQLLGYTEQKVKFNPLFLSLFFRRTVTFPTQEVMLDKITGKTPIAAYVSPVVGGKVLRNRGGDTCTWIYRSDECGYTGPAVADEFDNPTADPAKDACSRCARGCALRDNTGNFGGFLSINKLSQ